MNGLPFFGVLLVSDLDGTLVTDEGNIPQRNSRAIERFIEKGGRFSFATGRSVLGTERFASAVVTNAPSIVYNGGGIYDFSTKTLLWSKNLPDTYTVITKEVKRLFPDIGIEVYSGGSVYCMNKNKYTKEHIAFQGIDAADKDADEILPDSNKVLFCGDSERILQARAHMEWLEHKGLVFATSAPVYFELLPEGISKGATVKVLADMLGIAHDRIMAIGDYYNDLELIGTAAVGAVPEGAPEDIKLAADIVVGRSENGAVADFIEYLEKLFQEST